MQIELGVEPRADDRDDQASGIAEQGLIDPDHDHDRRDQDQGGEAVELHDLVDHGHDQDRRKDGQDADRQGSEADVAQGSPLLHPQIDEPSEIERRVGRDIAAAGAQQYRLAGPELGEPELVDGDRRGAGRRMGVLDEDDFLLGVGAGQQAGAAVFEQQHHWPRFLKAEQMAPADPDRARPHAGILRPHRQRGRRRRGLAFRAAELVRIELDAMVAPGLDHRLQARIEPVGAKSAGRPRQRLRERQLSTIHSRSLCRHGTVAGRQYGAGWCERETNSA